MEMSAEEPSPPSRPTAGSDWAMDTTTRSNTLPIYSTILESGRGVCRASPSARVWCPGPDALLREICRCGFHPDRISIGHGSAVCSTCIGAAHRLRLELLPVAPPSRSIFLRPPPPSPHPPNVGVRGRGRGRGRGTGTESDAVLVLDTMGPGLEGAHSLRPGSSNAQHAALDPFPDTKGFSVPCQVPPQPSRNDRQRPTFHYQRFHLF